MAKALRHSLHGAVLARPAEPAHAPPASQNPSFVEATLASLRASGFSPAFAMVWLNEMKLFGHQQWLAPGIADRDPPRSALEARKRLHNSLLSVEGDAGMKDWLATFPEHFRGQCRASGVGAVSSPIKPAYLRAAWGRAPGGENEPMQTFDALVESSKSAREALGFPLPSGDTDAMSSRLSGMALLDSDGPLEMAARMESDWDDVAYAVRKDCPAWLDPDAPVQPATPAQKQAFEKAMHRAGLGLLQWPALAGEDARTLAAMASGIARCATEIETTAGASPSDGLFGLRGRLRLALGVLSAVDSPYAGGDANGGAYVATTRGNEWGALAHEWMHALDSSAASETGERYAFATELASAKTAGKSLAAATGKATTQGPLQPWRDLVHALGTQCSVDRQAFTDMVEEAKASLVTRWAHTYRRQASEEDIAAVVESGRTGGASALGAAARRMFARTEEDPAASASRAILMEVEWKMLDAPRWSAGATLWTQFRKQATRSLDRDPGALAWMGRGYLEEPTEVLAHAFEGQVSHQQPEAMASDLRPPLESLRYPRPRELEDQKDCWARFFKDLLPQVRRWEQRARGPTVQEVGARAARQA